MAHPLRKAPASVVGRKDSNLRMVEAISGPDGASSTGQATSLGSAGAILFLRTNATNWPADVAPSPAVQLTSFPLVLYRSRTEMLCLHTNDRFAPMDETARAVERGGWRHSQYDGVAGRPVLG